MTDEKAKRNVELMAQGKQLLCKTEAELSLQIILNRIKNLERELCEKERQLKETEAQLAWVFPEKKILS